MKKFTKKRVAELTEKYGTPVGFQNNIPIFKAIKKNAYQMKIFCSYCKRWHLHGLTTEYGHRVAHCGDQRIGRKWQKSQDSPYYNLGYFIFLVDGEEK
ncbi:MAG: hypothetical protein H8D35_05940 [Nitrosopumilus sp.]|nr:hypothetical protein [Nitrosopumilus sp.]